MDKVNLAIIAAVVIILAGAGFFYFKQSSGPGPTNYDSFAKCLTEKGVKMYGAFWCTHCQNQKKAFGSSWQYVDFVECSTPDGKSQMGECSAAEIKGYPTWDFGNGTRREGEVSFSEIGKLSGCAL